jgi:hypothetical protein
MSTNPAGSSEAGSFTERLMALGRRAEDQNAAAAPPAAGGAEESLEITDRDIIFDCPRCYGELIVDRDGEQMETSCIHCGATLLVPKYMGPPSKVGKVQAQYAPGASQTGSAIGTNSEYRPATQDYTGVQTGDYATGATSQMIRNLAETVIPTVGPVTGEELPPPTPEPTSANSDAAAFTKADGTLTDEVIAEMRELNIADLEMEAVVAKLETIRRHLKENNSQVTEVTGYVNQTSIKLHRFKLQLERLKKRNSEIHKEMRALKARTMQLGGQAE